MKIKIILLITYFLVISILSCAQNQISGFIKDQKSGENLIGANIWETGTTNGTTSDNYGYFSLICKGNEINISFIGYKNASIKYTNDTLVTIFLLKGKLIEEITVTGILIQKFNTSKLSQEEMINTPSLSGKPDIIKALQLQPGIQTQNEGTSILTVRGGNPSENLYLLDNTPLIHVHHLGGFISVFDPEMINNLEVYKGGFPAKYGGKLSSIVSITQKEGNYSKVKGSLGIGITDVSFTIEGPILNKTASFICTGRKTLIDPLMMLVSGLSDGNDFFTLYGFHDINGKISWHPDKKNSLHVNIYQGDDYIKIWNKTTGLINEESHLGNTWGNFMASGKWNHIFSNKIFSNSSVSYSKYRLKMVNSYCSITNFDTTITENTYHSSVRDLSLHTDWKYNILKNWNIKFGAKATHLLYTPNKTTTSFNTLPIANESISTNEFSLYMSHNIWLSDFLNGEIGTRIVNYHSENSHKRKVEPRIMLNAHISPMHTINLTYQKVNQFAHLVFTTGNIINNEIWIPSNNNISPSNSEQYSFGWKANLFNNKYQIETNLYFKNMTQLVTYKEGYKNMIGDGEWRSKIETGGKGYSKGLEALIKKTKGKLTGMISYTYSNTNRNFPGINNGNTYLYEYDRPNSFSIYLNYLLNQKWTFNMAWVYQSGLPYTPVIGRQLSPTSEINEDGQQVYDEVFIFGPRNSARLKKYHRLDLAFIYTTTTKKGRNAQWSFSVYNAYNRANPATYYYGYNINGSMKNDTDQYKPLAQYQISYFPIIPSVSYKVFFE